MSQPKRIQRKRTKGWRLPHGATCVTRPGKWGNPFATAQEFKDVMNRIDRMDGMVEANSPEMQHMDWIYEHIDQLRGFDLACFCAIGKDCHADTLIKYANRKKRL